MADEKPLTKVKRFL